MWGNLCGELIINSQRLKHIMCKLHTMKTSRRTFCKYTILKVFQFHVFGEDDLILFY